jgi:phosphoribosylformylglycinamidine synthase
VVFTEPPEYRREGVKPAGLDALQAFDPGTLPDVTDAKAALLKLLASPEIASKRWIYRQYDHQVLTNTVTPPGSDAAVLRIKEAAPRAIAVATDGNGLKTYLDPFAGGALAVAEANRNVACTGARPVAITDCLNFGNPLRPDVYYQMEEAIKGMTAACEALSTPVVSGNVSLYNESNGAAIYPTPVVGALGIIEDAADVVPMGFQAAGDAVYLLGASSISGDTADLGGSEYLRQVHGKVAGRVSIDLELERKLQDVLVAAAEARLLRSAHDCSHGGLAVTIAEAAFQNEIGFDGSEIPAAGRRDATLFGEAASRVVVSVAPANVPGLEALAQQSGLPFVRLGVTGGDRLRLGDALDNALAELKQAFDTGLEDALQ